MIIANWSYYQNIPYINKLFPLACNGLLKFVISETQKSIIYSQTNKMATEQKLIMKNVEY
jgi:hypothetical protein